MPEFNNTFQHEQSKIAFSPDGKYIYDHYNGKVGKYEFATGNNAENITLSPMFSIGVSEFPEGFQIGTDGERLFFIDGVIPGPGTGNIKVYAMNGTFLQDISGIPYGFLISWSFSHADQRVWVYNTGNGKWEGYNIYEVPPEPYDAPMLPVAGAGLGIVGASMLLAYRLARKD